MKLVQIVFLLVAVGTCFSIGCGGSGEPTVIEPTETFQPTEQDKENQKKADALREQQQ